MNRLRNARHRMRSVAMALILLLVVPLGATPTAVAQDSPAVALSRLTVEKKAEPIGIDVAQPRFAWTITSTQHDVTQSSYRIVVAGPEGDVWDSGTVTSSQSIEIAYDGPQLTSDTRYTWDVTVDTTAGSAQGSSWFQTGLIDEAAWHDARWIGNDRPADTSGIDLTMEDASWIHPTSTGTAPSGFLRTSFDIPAGKTVDAAQITMAADDSYTAYLNGVQIVNRVAGTNAWQTAARATISPIEGQNVLAVRFNNTDGSGGLVGKIVIRFTDGTTQTVTTNGDWISTTALEVGWHLADHDTSAWTAVTVVGQYGVSPWASSVKVPSTPSQSTTMTFDTASWLIPPIGSPHAVNNPIPAALYRAKVNTSPTKTIQWAQLAVTSDLPFNAYWNGELVTSGQGTNNEWRTADIVNIAAVNGENQVAVSATPQAASANGAVLARVRVGYTDGSTSEWVTDGSTRTYISNETDAPSGWTSLNFDDSSWQFAQVLALYRGAVYADRVTIPTLDPLGQSLSFAGAKWIWSDESTNPPAEPRVFRRVIDAPAGKTAKQAEVIITGDDSYQLWVNGSYVGQAGGGQNQWQRANSYRIELADTDKTVIAARAGNANESNGSPSPAGLVAAVRITYSDNSQQVVLTDSSFKVSKTVPTNFHAIDADDSSWAPATERADFGSGPWGTRVQTPTPTPDSAPILRREFEASANTTRATLHFAAGAFADFSINGEPVADEMLSPGFTDYDDTVQYRSIDVTDLVADGDNVISAELGRGFYAMTGSNVWRWQSPSWRDEPKVRAVLSITRADGTTSHIVTDESWTIHDGPRVFDDMYAGEIYDASREVPGYDQPGFDDSMWSHASVVAAPKGELVNQRQQPIRIVKEHAAESITEPVPGTYVIKFPVMLAGNVRITAQGPKGSAICFKYAEKLLPDGLLNMSNNGGFGAGFQTDTFVLAGTGAPETWNARFSYKGFQYIEVSGWPDGQPPLDAFTALEVHTDAERTGEFTSSEPVMNSVHQAVVQTLYNNIHGIPTDTPMFEKNGWTGDAAVGAEMFLMNLDTTELFAKWIRDLDESRRPDGAPMVIAPSSTDWGDWGTAPTWHSVYVFLPWWLNQYSGDRQVIDTYYDNIKQYVDLEYDRSPNGIAQTRLGDWVSPDASPAGGNAPEDRRVSATAYLYGMLTTMAQVAQFKNLLEDAAQFTQRAEVVKQAFNREFYDSAAGYYRGVGDTGYRQTHNVLAVAFGLAPDAETKQKAVDSIAADVTARGVHLHTGVLGTKYLLPVLTDNGYADLAYQLAVQTTYPSWGYKIDNGATSMWEHWAVEARSLGHYFLGTVDDWYYHYVLGLKPDTVQGWREISVAPKVTASMQSASGLIRTPYGDVESSWQRSHNLLNLDVTVPVGSTARVLIPAKTAVSIQESGQPLGATDGIHQVEVKSDGVEVTVGSGSYAFVVDARADKLASVASATDALDDSVRTHLEGSSLTNAVARIAEIRDISDEAVAALRNDDATGAAEQLTQVSEVLDELLTLAGSSGDVRAAIDKLRRASGNTIGELLQISVSIFPGTGASVPGGTNPVNIEVSNQGTSTVSDVDVSVSTWTESIVAHTATSPIATELAGDSSASSSVDLVTSRDALPGEYPMTAVATYVFAGKTVTSDRDFMWTVTSGAQISQVNVSPAKVAPGGSLSVSVQLSNPSAVGLSGRVFVEGPEPWRDPLPSPPVHIPAGQSVTVEIPVDVPWDSPTLEAHTALDIAFVAGSTTLVSSTADAVVELPAVVDTLDHIDLGESTSETAHNLTAHSASGTNSEAGLTRRYAGHLTDFSWFEFDMQVEPNQPFLLRSIETYDRSQTKRYKIYIDGQEVTLRQYPHTTGAGTETWQALIPAEYAPQSGVVRVKYETQNDHTFYDPSIADVWTLALPADTVAPQVTVSTTPQLPAQSSGWYRDATVQAAVTARDARDDNVTIAASLSDELAPYAQPFEVTGEGEHTIKYRAADSSGNQTAVLSFTMKIDSVALTTTATVVGKTDNGTASVQLDAQDATSGVAETWYRLDGGDWIQADRVEISGVGDHRIEYRSIDVAGNIEEPGSLNVTITGQTPPTWNLGTNPPGVLKPGAQLTASIVTQSAKPAKKSGWYRKKVRVTVSGTAPANVPAVVQYRVNNGAWSTYRAPIVIKTNGSTRVQARTIAMTSSSMVVNRTVAVDRIKPKKVKKLTTIVTKGKKRFVRFKAKEAHSGVAKFRYKTPGKKWRVAKSAKKLKKGVRISRAKQVIKVRAIDKAGNKSKVFKIKVKRAKLR